jgi:hypothetical protein
MPPKRTDTSRTFRSAVAPADEGATSIGARVSALTDSSCLVGCVINPFIVLEFFDRQTICFNAFVTPIVRKGR